MRVGVFDSGLGGLTVVQAITKSFKGADIFYVADTKFAPYGEKSKEQILQRSINITEYLIANFKIEVLIVACNTATSAAIKELRELFKNLIVIGTEPGIKPAVKATKSKRIGVLATPATLSGDKYKELLTKLSFEHDFSVYEVACAGLVEQIENGKIFHEDTYNMLEKWLGPMKKRCVDTIVLGCTHYPLVSEVILQIMGKDTILIETGEAIARRLDELCKKSGYCDNKEIEVEVYYTGEIKKDMINVILNRWKDCGKISIKEVNE
ncbi:glutamate racemase [Halarcobacter ebronensis]|uniref:Glutamate racemase n=1 Tax=Halarcobacter ebronensis TaxID=1462615 RepID=A0A4Q1AFS7_9BACT|nr:glutamate racemase [Halarcobacter ebronensis]QKF83085.1 glutamate racemase [Halarcobacter ebronensis]RXK02400.1 glutamate racemase [Halarcobacter ebronensis]